MRKINILIIFMLVITVINANSQSFINGDFENNTSVGCSYNMPDTVFNTKMPNVYAFGKGYTGTDYCGEIDIQAYGCYVYPQHNDWCIGLSSDRVSPTVGDAVAIELSQSLIVGEEYELSFYVFGNTYDYTYSSNIIVGESIVDTAFGIQIQSLYPDTNVWKQVLFVFEAAQKSKYITVKAIGGYCAWTQIDNFTINHVTTGISSNEIFSETTVFPNPIESDLNIDFGLVIPKVNITVFNNIGREIIKKEFCSHKNVKLNLHNIPCGMYYVKLKTEDEEKTIKIIKK